MSGIIFHSDQKMSTPTQNTTVEKAASTVMLESSCPDAQSELPFSSHERPSEGWQITDVTHRHMCKADEVYVAPK